MINGIDTKTNNHDTGTRKVWSGSDRLDAMATSALIASQWVDQVPLPFLSYGGYDAGGSLISPTRVADTRIMQEMAMPNLTNPGSNERQYFSNAVYQKVQAARAARLGQMQNDLRLHQQQQLLNELAVARMSDNNLQNLVTRLPASISSGLRGQAEVAVAAFASGTTVCANLRIGGFDTHGNHDASAFPRMAQILDAVDHIMVQAELQGIRNQVTVIVGSDFGRTPWYNATNGKDHWNVTSMLALGKGVNGGRTVGATNANQQAMPINSATLQPDANGIILTTEHVNQAIRGLSPIAALPAADLGVERLAIF